VLLASASIPCAKVGVGTPGNAKSPLVLGDRLGRFGRLLAGSCAAQHAEVASHAEIFRSLCLNCLNASLRVGQFTFLQSHGVHLSFFHRYWQ